MPLDLALADHGAVMESVLAARLGIGVGDSFRLGTQEFTLRAALVREPDKAISGLSLGPTTIVRSDALGQSGLLGEGTLYDTEYYLRLPSGADPAALEADANRRLDTSGWRWRDARNGSGGIGRFVDRLSSFLVLVGLAGLAVGGVGVASAVRAYLGRKTATIATLKTLGAERRTVMRIYALQVAALGGFGIALGVVLGAALPLALSPMIAARLPVPSEFGLYPRPLAEAALYGILSTLLFTLWPLARTEDMRATALYRDAAIGGGGWPRRRWILATMALLILTVGLAAVLSGLRGLTLWSAAGLGGSFVVLLLVAAGVRRAARAAARARVLRGRTTLRLALGAVGGPGGDATSVVLSLGLGLTVLAAVGQISANLREAISRDLPAVAPAYFMLDIQSDQLDQFRAILDATPGVSRVETAPMLRGVITEIDGRPASEVAGDHWVLRGDRGLTYAATPPEGTTLTAGQWWQPDATDPQLSFAAEEAEEMGLSLGDTLTVDVLGRPVTATITSLRAVDFSSAGMSFVMVMNPAALEGAPHTSIATIYAPPEAEAPILRDISRAFPNVTAIRVRDAIDRAVEVLSGIAAAVTWGAAATLLTGIVVLVGAAAAGEAQRVHEAAVLRTLGATRARILANFALRSAILGAAAGGVAILAGAAAGWGVMTYVMESTFRFQLLSALWIVGGGALVTTLAGLAFAWRPLSVRPARVLRALE